jgi:alpha-tubulin suppressor-like RCC1 family protein
MAQTRLLVFGDNRTGQAGISEGDDFITTPTDVSHIDFCYNIVSRIAVNQNQLFLVFSNGTLFTAGENDNNELARTGKRSLLQRVDALETFQISQGSIGSKYALLVCNDGRILGWGSNDMGQLGNGNREFREKPKLNAMLKDEPFLQISSGLQHTVALTKYGKVVSWGGNLKGQLGDGQLSSSTTPIPIIQLRHRPIIAVSCGENHTLVMTLGGNVYSWGDNSQGQLGQGDCTNRLRPQLIKSLRSIKATKICAGGQHSVVVSSSNLVFSFGSNSFGQCGTDSGSIKSLPSPQVIDRLRELCIVGVACGAAHTMVLIESLSTEFTSSEPLTDENFASSQLGNIRSSNQVAIRSRKVYVMGLNSCGQVRCVMAY